MPELRNTIKREISDALDSTSFTSEDFSIEYDDISIDKLFMLTFEHDSQFNLNVHISGGGQYLLSFSPGTIHASEQSYVKGFPGVLAKIKEWAGEIRSELKASQPLYREVDELRKTLEESITSSFIEGNDEFSVAEINELRRKFEALEERVSELEQEDKITNSQREKLSNDIQQVSEDIEVYPKQAWVKTSVNKPIGRWST